MSIYRPPDPPMGPDRPSDAYPLTDAAEVAAVRRFGVERDGVPVPFIEEFVIPLGPEEFMAERDRERWGDAPFEAE